MLPPQRSTGPKIAKTWQALPSLLAGHNKTFSFKTVTEGASIRGYAEALFWLVEARLVYQIYLHSDLSKPLVVYDDRNSFKVYPFDVGLLWSLAKMPSHALSEEMNCLMELNGALAETFVLQGLMANGEVLPRFSDAFTFLIRRQGCIFPIEVKAEANAVDNSLEKHALLPEEIKLRIRFSLSNLKLDGNVLNIPLFMIDQTDLLIELALNHNQP